MPKVPILANYFCLKSLKNEVWAGTTGPLLQSFCVVRGNCILMEHESQHTWTLSVKGLQELVHSKTDSFLSKSTVAHA